MGWKTFKEHYRIEHTVHVRRGGKICIGSAYVSEIIVVSPEGVIEKRSSLATDGDLGRYLADMDADPATLRRVIQCEDAPPKKSVTVFTYAGGKILEKQCEEPGWPNVTHDGELMYDNSFSTDKALVVKWAKRNAAAGAKLLQDRISELKESLAEKRRLLAEDEANLAELNAAYPEEPAAAATNEETER